MKKIKSLNVILYAYMSSIFAQGVFTPVYAFFVQKIGGGILETTWAISLYFIVTGVITLLISSTHWSQKYVKECLIIGWALWVMSVILYFFVSSITVLFFCEVLNGFGSAFSSPAYDAEYSLQASDNLLWGWGKFEGCTSIFSGIASLTSGFIVTYFGFKVLMFSMAFVATISFLLILYYVKLETNKVK